MNTKKKDKSEVPKLKKINIDDTMEKDIPIMKKFFEKYGKLTTIKLLLVKINNLLEYENKAEIVYRAVQNKSIMYIYLFDYDLMVSLIKPMTVTNPKNPELDDILVKKVTIRISQISSYGNYTKSIYFDNEELQNYLKKLYYKLIEHYYNKLNKIDKLVNQNLSGNKTGEGAILSLIAEQVYNSFNNDDMINNCLEEFNSVTEKDIKRSSGIHRLFF